MPNVFQQLGAAGGVPLDEQFRAFNMGVGLMAILDPQDTAAVIASAKSSGVHAWLVGEVGPGSGTVRLDDR